MTSKFLEYLYSLDNSFKKTLSGIDNCKLKIKPKHGLLVIEPSITETANLGIYVKNKINLDKVTQEQLEKHLREDEIFIKAIKSHAYDFARVRNQLSQYLWSKNYAVADSISSLQLSLGNGHLLSSLTILRSAFEQISDVVLIKNLLGQVSNETSSLKDAAVSIQEFSDFLHKHILATRIDWEHYLENPIKGGKKKSYSPKEDLVNVEAESVLYAIDALDKRIKGSRRAYEFLCEFSHPNVGTYFVYRSGKKVVKRNSTLTFIETILSNNIPSDSIDWLKKPVFETFEIFLESLIFYIQLTNEIDKKCKLLDKKNKEIVKQIIKNNINIWTKEEPCPCLSGNAVALCCGKSLPSYPSINE